MKPWVKFFSFSFFLMYSSLSYSDETLNKLSSSANEQAVCDATFQLDKGAQKSESSYPINSSVTLAMTQFLSKKTVQAATLATNVYCQKLTGMKYTGSDEEWQGYFKNTAIALANKGANNLQYTIIGTDQKAYKGTKLHREFKFNGDFDEGHQVIYNLAVLDIQANIMYTISVSGNYKIEDYVHNEFQHIVSSSSL